MESPLAKDTQGVLSRIAAKSPESECCGFILGDGKVFTIPNVSVNPARAFFMDPQEQIAFIREHGRDIIGVFHTHPGGTCEPSKQDKAGWHPAMPWRYFIVTTQQITEWKKVGDDVSRTASYNTWTDESSQDLAPSLSGE